MTAAGPPPVLSGLVQAAEALEGGQLEAAADLLSLLAARCGREPGDSWRLSAPELQQARDLYARCQRAADRQQAALLASASQSATVRKATNVYLAGK
jgi:hypothetical protein